MNQSKINYTLFITLLLSIILYSCERETAHKDPSPEDITINIESPLELQEYEFGDTVFINAKITSPFDLHGYEVHLLRLADTTEVLSKDLDLHQASFEIKEFWVNDGKVHSDMELEIKAMIDHNGNAVGKKVHFHCHPM